MNFKLKANFWDIIITVFIIILSLILSVFFYFIPANSGDTVGVYVMGKLEYQLSLNEDTTLTLHKGEYNNEMHTFPHLLGDLTIEIKDEKVRILENECPNKICVNQGWVSIANIPITCAPNNVVIVIENVNSDTPDIIM